MFDQKPGGVEDIFDNTVPAASAPQGTSSVGAQGTVAPVSASPAPPASLPTNVAPLAVEAGGGVIGFLRGKLVWAILGGSVLVVLVGGGLYLALRGGTNAPPSAPTIAEPQAPEEAVPPAPPATPGAEAVAAPTPTDTDRDGLADTDEASYGTNPSNADTDNDQLSDADEIRVYKTNPLVPDTDGDTYLDGAEVKAGYDPNGSGTLQDVQKALQK